MKKLKILTIIFCLTLVALSGSVSIQAEVSQSTINYLLAQTQNQWLTMALAANNQTNPDLSYLNNFNGSYANDYSKTILALTAAGENPYNYQNTDFVASLRNFYQNGQFGEPSLLSDDFWAIMALASAGISSSDEQIQSSKNFIVTNQNSDGGWSYAPSGQSDTNDTSASVMALLDAGLSSGDQVIQSGVSYLHNQQNADGGFPFSAPGESDSGSDAWAISAIYKLGQNPIDWVQGTNSPISHLQSLMLEDGSFKWLASDSQGNPLMTAYAAVALSARFYPVNYYQPNDNQNLHHLRIEGATQTYCDEQVQAASALEIVINGAPVCGYTYNIEQTDFGPYLVSINNESAQGMSGWLYWVNWQSPSMGANDYLLEPGDEVLWAFGNWPMEPLKISLSAGQIEPNQSVTATVEHYNGEVWLASAEATVRANGQTYQTDAGGQVSLTFPNAGSYEIYAEKDNFVRSPRVELIVGSGVSQNVSLQVNIEAGSGGETLSFTVNPNDLNFGSLRAGEEASQNVTVNNNGNVPIHLEAMISGDQLFQDATFINDQTWGDYSDQFAVSQASTLEVDLRVPSSYASAGVKQGNLIFWATRQ